MNRNRSAAPRITDPVAPRLTDPIAPRIPDPIAPRIPVPVAHRIPDPVAHRIPDPVAHRIPDPVAHRIPVPTARITVPVDSFDINCVLQCPPVRNIILHDSRFHRLQYAMDPDALARSNGLHLHVWLPGHFYPPPSPDSCIHPSEQKFWLQPSSAVLQQLEHIEEELLLKHTLHYYKTPVYKLRKQFAKGFLYANPAQSQPFLLKISGLWETETEYGLTFKFTLGSSANPP